MTGELVPGGEHVARYCTNKQILRDQTTGAALRVDLDAFKPRVDKGTGAIEPDISVNRLQFYSGGSLVEQVATLERQRRSIGHNIKKNGGFAVGTAQEIVEAGETENTHLEVRTDPMPNDPSHAVILGIELDADLVQEAIARKMIVYSMTSF